MNSEKFKDILQYNEPSFGYNGHEYSICSPDGMFYVMSSDNPTDSSLEFSSVDALLDGWIIQGKPLRDILPHIDLN